MSQKDGWYYHQNDQTIGPFSHLQIKGLIESGTLERDTQIWNPEVQGWVKAGALEKEWLHQHPPPPPFKAEPKPEKTSSTDVKSAAQTETVEVDKRDESPQNGGNYFTRHWRGQLSLPKTYWLGQLIVYVIIFVYYVGFGAVEPTKNPILFASLGIGGWILIGLAQIWLSVGIFRSATVYTKTKKKAWGSLAKVAAALGLLGTTSTFLQTGVPQIGGFVEIIEEANNPNRRFALRIVNNGTELDISGDIDFGISDAIKNIIRDHPDLKAIRIDSQGGRIAEAQRISQIIEQKGMSTFVSDVCASACVNIFAAGKERILRRGAKIGLHAAYFPGIEEAELRAGNQQTISYLVSRGVDRAFVSKGLSYSYTSMWYPTEDELIKSRLVTRFADADDILVSDTIRSVEEARLAFLKVPLYAAIKRIYPDEWTKLEAELLNAVAANKTMTETQLAVHPLIQPLITKAMPTTSDSGLMAFWKAAALQYKKLQSVDPALCQQYAFEGADSRISGILQGTIVNEIEAMAKVVGDVNSYTDGSVAEEKYLPALTKLASMAANSDITQEQFFDALDNKGTADVVCKVWVLFAEQLSQDNDTDFRYLRRAFAQFSAQDESTANGQPGSQERNSDSDSPTTESAAQRPSVASDLATGLEILRREVGRCWYLPPGAKQASGLIVTLRFELKPDGFLANEPVVENFSDHFLFDQLATSAVQAVRSCQPYRMFAADRYSEWRDIRMHFDPATVQ